MVIHKSGYWLGLIVLLALALRLYPYLDFTAHGTTFAGSCGPLFEVVKPLVNSGNLLNFEVFFYPPVAPLIIAGATKITAAIIPSALDFDHHCLVITIVFSTATIVVLYYIGREWSPTVGLLAAAFFAVTMIAIDSASNVQVYSAFFTLLAIYFFYKCQHKPATANLALMGIFLGLAIGSKYFPVVLVPMFFILHFVGAKMADTTAYESDALKDLEPSRGKFQNVIMNASLLVLLFTCLGTLYFGVFHPEFLLTFLKEIYDKNAHDHPFEYHLYSIQKILNLGFLGIGAVGICAASGILIPTIKGRDAWEWVRECFHRHRLWIVPSVSMIITLVVAIGIPAISNLNRYAAYTVWMANAYASSDGGMFPAGMPAPSYFLSFFPENLGMPLFLAGCAGLGYCLFTRQRKAITLLLIVLPLYLMLERSSVKVNRYALELMPMFCLFAAIGLERLSRITSSSAWRIVSIGLSFTIFTYSTLYVLAWANVTRPNRDVRIEATEWIKAHVSEGRRIGMRGHLWVTNSPQLIPNPNLLTDYKIEDYTNHPDYIVIPKLLFEVVGQYDRLTKGGYAYRQTDWTPQSPPSPEELDVLINIVNQRQYVLVKEFEKFPALGGVSFDNQRFAGRTWFREHAGPYGIQIYQKREISSQVGVLATSQS